MRIMEIAAILAALFLGIYATIDDIRNGVVRNTPLLVFLVVAILWDVAYYGCFAHDLIYVL